MNRIVSAALLFFLSLLSFTGLISYTSKLNVTGVAQAQTSSAAELPRVYIDTTYVAPTGNTINVPSGGNLQSALNLARPGDTIVLQSGAIFVAPAGGFTLPAK